jgi:hypothetical protein
MADFNAVEAEATIAVGTQRLGDGITAAGGIFPPGALAALIAQFLPVLLNLLGAGGICPKPPTPTPTPTPAKDPAQAVAETRATVAAAPVVTQMRLVANILAQGLASTRRDARTLAQGSINALTASTDDELVKMVAVHNAIQEQAASMPM